MSHIILLRAEFIFMMLYSVKCYCCVTSFIIFVIVNLKEGVNGMLSLDVFAECDLLPPGQSWWLSWLSLATTSST